MCTCLSSTVYVAKSGGNAWWLRLRHALVCRTPEGARRPPREFRDVSPFNSTWLVMNSSESAMRVAFFGGSFNPPHVAHVLACTYALSTGLADRVLVVPVFQHPFDKPLAPFEDRLAMARLALDWIPGVEVSEVERGLSTPSLTLNTLEHLSRENPDWQLRLMVGSDVLFEAQKWHAFDAICAIAPPLVLGRVGYEHSDAPVAVLPDLSSTKVRELFSDARRGADSSAAARKTLAAMLPRAVLEHAERQGLYP